MLAQVPPSADRRQALTGVSEWVPSCNEPMRIFGTPTGGTRKRGPPSDRRSGCRPSLPSASDISEILPPDVGRGGPLDDAHAKTISPVCLRTRITPASPAASITRGGDRANAFTSLIDDGSCLARARPATQGIARRGARSAPETGDRHEQGWAHTGLGHARGAACELAGAGTTARRDFVGDGLDRLDVWRCM